MLLLTMAASIGYLTIGLVRGYSSSAVPSMEAENPHLVSSVEAESWISAVPPLGAFFGSIMAGALMQKLGRKYTLLISSPLSILGWCLIATATTTDMIIVARFITGICAGIATPSAQVYVSECSDPEIRGVLGSMPAFFMAGGILVSYIAGAWLSWYHLAWASVVFPALLFFVLLPLPESPVWLLGKGRTEEADDALRWLHRFRGPTDALPMELKQSCVYTVKQDFMDVSEPKHEKKNEKEPSPFSRAELFRRPVMIPLLLSLALLIFQQLSGIDAVIFYTVAIFESAGSTVDDHLATILVGLVQLVSNFFALFLIDRAGRRPLLIVSGFLMSISMAALGTYFYLHEKGEGTSLGILPLISLVVFMFGFSIGYCSIPFLLMGEILPRRQRSIFSSFAGSLNLGAMFVVIKTYPNLKIAMGSEGTFWLYSLNCLLSCFFVGFLLPETKGKSLDEIEQYFEDRHVAKVSKCQQGKLKGKEDKVLMNKTSPTGTVNTSSE